jgi:hypothetical protein
LNPLRFLLIPLRLLYLADHTRIHCEPPSKNNNRPFTLRQLDRCHNPQNTNTGARRTCSRCFHPRAKGSSLTRPLAPEARIFISLALRYPEICPIIVPIIV